MNVRKQAAALLLCLILAASLVACQRPGATEGTRREGSEQTGTEQREQTETASVPQTDPTHFYEEVQEDLLIDAEVKGTASGAKPKVYLRLRKTGCRVTKWSMRGPAAVGVPLARGPVRKDCTPVFLATSIRNIMSNITRIPFIPHN